MNFIDQFLFITVAAAFVSSATATYCETDNDCILTEQCDEVTNLCFNPCDLPHPGLFNNGDCIVFDHRLRVDCHEGYDEVPCSYSCEKSTSGKHLEGEPCCTSRDCIHSLVCHRRKCFDACKLAAADEDEFCAIYNHTVVDMRLVCG